jgi:SNW domain-containing protein 1
MSQESMYDQRLFNQTSGLTSGFGSSSSYNLYDKPLFNATAQSIYKPTRGGEEENAVAGVGADQFASLLAKGPHKKFAGTDLVDGASRSGPVQFEKEEDVFGVDAFMSAAKRGRGKEEEDERDAQKKSRK